MDLGRVEGDGVFGKFESLLDQGREFTNSSSLLAENFLGVGCADDDVGDGRSDADFDTRVSLFGQFSLKELIQFGKKHSISDLRSENEVSRVAGQQGSKASEAGKNALRIRTNLRRFEIAVPGAAISRFVCGS